MSREICCADCHYFSPGEFGCSAWEITRESFKKHTLDTERLCRFNPPVTGGLGVDSDGFNYLNYGLGVKVCGGDWCGKFKPHEYCEEDNG